MTHPIHLPCPDGCGPFQVLDTAGMVTHPVRPASAHTWVSLRQLPPCSWSGQSAGAVLVALALREPVA